MSREADLPRSDSYARAGVDIDAGNRAVELMTEAVRSTYGPEVLLGIGAFGGLFDASRLKEMRRPVLVASTDSVGTKVMVAAALGSYHTLGVDIVHHCLNDILVQGAEPLFFLDYVAMPRLDPEVVAEMVGGIAAACREAGCAILGGETAELPGVYAPGELDLVGAIVGVVEREEIITGDTIVAGDALIGLPSDGLHTNGYSLARRIIPPEAYGRYVEELGQTVGEALTVPHRSYLPAVRALRRAVRIKGLAHITGGGLIENVPRLLPEGLAARIARSTWEVPPLFRLLAREGDVAEEEMFRVFNMGIGMVAAVAHHDAAAALAALAGEGRIIGAVVRQEGARRVVLA